MYLTTFKSRTYKTKIPVPTHPEKSFEFKTFLVKNIKEIFEIMSTEYIMSKPLSNTEPIIIPRRLEFLNDYKVDTLDYLVLDIDDIKTKQDYNKIVKFFKTQKYEILLGKSRSWDGNLNFNIKGFIKVNIPNDRRLIKEILFSFEELLPSCKMDVSCAGDASIQAPMNRCDIIYYGGEETLTTELQETITKQHNLEVYTAPFINVCLGEFFKRGFTPLQKQNSNGTINFTHFSEVKSKGGYFWSEKIPYIMFHNNESKVLNIYKEMIKTKEGKDFFKQKFELKNLELLRPKELIGKTIHVTERFLEVSDDVRNFISEFLNSEIGVLEIKSPMGTGKSNIIDAVIENSHYQGLKVLIVSNRISVAEDFSKKYGIKMYGEVYSEESLIVQFDSLYKYNIQDFDILIVDEFMSVLLHHKSNLSDFQNINIAKFYTALKTKKVLIADAFLIGFENQFFEDRDCWNIINHYRDNILLTSYNSKDSFIQQMLDYTLLHKATASFSSIKVLKYVEKRLQNNGLKVQVLTSETPKELKDLIYQKFEDINNNHWDVLLFSPTLTVGVSNNNLITKHFHFDEGNSMDVISSLQMVKRTRSATEIDIYLGKRQMFSEIDVEVLNAITEETLGKYADKDKSLLFNYDVMKGTIKVSEIGQYVNKIESLYNTIENCHWVSFMTLLENQFNTNPQEGTKNTTLNISKEFKEIKDKQILEDLSILIDMDFKFQQETYLDLVNKKRLSPEEKMIKLFGDNTKDFNIPEIYQKEYLCKLIKDKNTSKYVRYLTYFFSDKEVLKEKFRYMITHQKVQDLEFLFFDYILNNNITLKEYYSKNDLKDINLKKILGLLGYKFKRGRFSLDADLLKYIKV